MGREAKTHNQLTKKQDSFVKGILSGKTPTQSAMAIYDVSNPKTASVIASENLTKPNIREALEESLRTSGLSLSVITGNIGNLANAKPEKISGDTVLRANIELMKLHGAYLDKKSFQFSYSVKERVENMSYKELKEKMAKLDADLKELLEEDTPRETQDSLE